MKGQVSAGGRLCAEAEGIFISVARERFQALEAQRAERKRAGEGG